MPTSYNVPLIAGSYLSATAAMLHIGIIINGASWYRFFGASEAMARAVERGRHYPAIVTATIALVLGVWSAYALSAAGFIRAAPFLKPILCAITLAYLLRGLVLVPVLIMPRTKRTIFGLWSSGICLIFAATHLIGLFQVWGRL